MLSGDDSWHGYCGRMAVSHPATVIFQGLKVYELRQASFCSSVWQRTERSAAIEKGILWVIGLCLKFPDHTIIIAYCGLRWICCSRLFAVGVGKPALAGAPIASER